MKDREYKKIIEAIFFSSNKPLSLEGISKRANMPEDFVKEKLVELRDEYKDRGMKIDKEGKKWDMTLEDSMVSEVRGVIKPEFSKALLETLATIAINEPIKQSKVVKIRGNKAYNHVETLEERGFIKTKPIKRTRQVELTEKFFSYFEIEKNKIEEELSQINGMEKVKE